jgi:hypothetical protein
LKNKIQINIFDKNSSNNNWKKTNTYTESELLAIRKGRARMKMGTTILRAMVIRCMKDDDE